MKKNSFSPPLITIDGPSASGKSSVARELAKSLQWKWLSTGIFYRGLAFIALERKVDIHDEEKVLKWLQQLQQKDWSVRTSAQYTCFYYKDKEETEILSQNKIGSISSELSQYRAVRQFLLAPQRECYKKLERLAHSQRTTTLSSTSCSSPSKARIGFIAEGRDCGTVIFPQANLKIYLTAKKSLRLERRAKELGLSEKERKAFESSQEKRDLQDKQRKEAPLKKAEGAWIIDSSEQNLISVVNLIKKKIQDLHFV